MRKMRKEMYGMESSAAPTSDQLKEFSITKLLPLKYSESAVRHLTVVTASGLRIQIKFGIQFDDKQAGQSDDKVEKAHL